MLICQEHDIPYWDATELNFLFQKRIGDFQIHFLLSATGTMDALGI